jgi:hypothetical protein
MLSVITTLIHIMPSGAGKLQQDAELSPSNWLKSDPEAMTKAVDDISKLYENSDCFRHYRNCFAAADHLREVFKQHAVNGEVISDSVDTAAGVTTGHAQDKDPPCIAVTFLEGANANPVFVQNTAPVHWL